MPTPLKHEELRRLADTEPWTWDESTGPALLATLRDSAASDEDRVLAAELAGDPVVLHDALADELLSTVKNASANEQLRSRSAIALGPALELASIEFDNSSELSDPESVPISEKVYAKIKSGLRSVYHDASTPKLVRRRALEAALRAADDWHQDAIRAAYRSGDRDWRLTAVFGMRFVAGFDDQIIESLNNDDPEIHLEAVRAAGSHALAAAWKHVVDLVSSKETPKHLLLAAIETVPMIRPENARAVLADWRNSDDPEISETVEEALTIAELP